MSNLEDISSENHEGGNSLLVGSYETESFLNHATRVSAKSERVRYTSSEDIRSSAVDSKFKDLFQDDMEVKKKKNRAASSLIGIPGSVNLLAGKSWVARDEPPSRREQKIDISESSKA